MANAPQIPLIDDIALPATTRRDMKAACDLQFELKDKALERLRVDLAEVRGGRVLDHIEGDIRDARRGTYRTVLFSGHVGSGKTTELRWLTRLLEATKEGQCFHVVWIDAQEYLDLNAVQLPEFLVAVFNALIEDPLLKPYVSASTTAKETWRRLREWLKPIGLDLEGELSLGAVKLKARAKTEFGLQKRMQEALRTRITELLALLSELLVELRAALAKQRVDDIVIVADNLEKILLTELDHGVSNTHDLFFIEQLPKVQQLQVHMVLTVPVSLHFAHARLRQVFLNPTVKVLPMVPVHHLEQPDTPHDRGCAVLKELLQRRVDTDKLFADEAALAHAIALSGGVLRDLFRIVLEGLSRKPSMGLTVNDLDDSVRDMVSSFERMLQGKAYLPQLHTIAACGCFPVGFDDDARNTLLHSMVVLEYNGTTWYDVHPLARRTRAYLTARPPAPESGGA